MVNRVVRAVAADDLKSTSKYGSNNVAAGATLMSHVSSLLVVDGPDAAPPTPGLNVAFGVGIKLCVERANAGPTISVAASIARTVSFLISFSYTSIVESLLRKDWGHPLSTIRSPPAPFVTKTSYRCQLR